MSQELISISKMIDHSLLHPQLTDKDLISGCHIAVKFNVAAVCIKPYAVREAKEWLSNSTVKLATVIGFPHGSSKTDVKLIESDQAIEDGAEELDLVINIGKLRSGDWNYITREIRMINDLVLSRGGLLKVIFENDYLEKQMYKVHLCDICNEIEVAFVKTSTGYAFLRQNHGSYDYHGATDDDLRLMRRKCKPTIQIKAAGKVRTLDDILRIKALGVTRVGATATESIIIEAQKRGFH